MTRMVQVTSSLAMGLGGAENVMLSLAREGQRRGWTQLLLNPCAATPGGLAAHCEGVPYETLQCDGVSAFPRVRRWLGRRIGEFQPDIVHVHLPLAHLAVASLRRPPGSSLIVTHHHGRHLVWEGRRWAALVDRLSGRRYDRVVACCEAVRTFLLESYGYPSSATMCIRNGWTGTPQSNTAKDPRPTVVCVAHFRRQKAHSVLIEAFARVRERIPEVRLALIGWGPLQDEITGQIRALELQDRVTMGLVDDVWPLLGRSHVFALASHYEGLPLAVLEAMAAGLPVVATAVDGVAEVVQPGVTGYLVPPGDPIELGDRLTAVLADPQLQQRMGGAGRAAAANETMDRCVARYFDLYEEMLSRRAGRLTGGPRRSAPAG
jgi:glycosyltransferase involved in cell wall biosynthesis